MRKNLNRTLLTVLITTVLYSACNKKLDIKPTASLAASQIFTNATNVENAINSVYAQLQNGGLYGRDMLAIADALGDITFSNGRGSRFVSENANQAGSHMANWNPAYAGINEANLILDAIANVPGATTTQKTRWEGELKFIRALLYHDLVRSYAYDPTFIVALQDKGGVVLKLTGTNAAVPAIEYKPKRATVTEVYTQIIADLNNSLTMLSTNNRGVAYASRHAALALLARVYLYMGDWVKAEDFANQAMTVSGGIGALTTTANYIPEWRKATHQETIFEVRFFSNQESLGSAVSLHGSYTNLLAIGDGTKCPPGGIGGFAPLVPNQKLLTELGVGPVPSNGNMLQSALNPCTGGALPPVTRGVDVRGLLYEYGNGPSPRYIETTKFLGKSGFQSVDNVPVIRWSELILIRAEARYRRGGAYEALALADLNTFRTNRYTAGATVTLTGTALFNEIMRQRLLEFAFEGHRWFDMKRNGMINVKPTPSVNMDNTDFRWLARIPQADIDGNPNMVQNFGY